MEVTDGDLELEVHGGNEMGAAVADGDEGFDEQGSRLVGPAPGEDNDDESHPAMNREYSGNSDVKGGL
ncbi:unnamed protein product [Linum trigynum]|uniref:Uncharacterized protein n=1 Tax=Linum trigynum TaxID=586398 RepID=A0AAV2CBX4_9ROSI